ncbi:unnamed protein product [Mesocestoides corti]|uniref:Cell division cycle-associated protein 2 n=1 Tax=Mesocestoides corti TaxID=53468 RepID=A0A0R3UKN4_MESCO|nr:unnamed protein product [Mesocestoides corti]
MPVRFKLATSENRDTLLRCHENSSKACQLDSYSGASSSVASEPVSKTSIHRKNKHKQEPSVGRFRLGGDGTLNKYMGGLSLESMSEVVEDEALNAEQRLSFNRRPDDFRFIEEARAVTSRPAEGSTIAEVADALLLEDKTQVVKAYPQKAQSALTSPLRMVRKTFGRKKLFSPLCNVIMKHEDEVNTTTPVKKARTIFRDLLVSGSSSNKAGSFNLPQIFVTLADSESRHTSSKASQRNEAQTAGEDSLETQPEATDDDATFESGKISDTLDCLSETHSIVEEATVADETTKFDRFRVITNEHDQKLMSSDLCTAEDGTSFRTEFGVTENCLTSSSEDSNLGNAKTGSPQPQTLYSKIKRNALAILSQSLRSRRQESLDNKDQNILCKQLFIKQNSAFAEFLKSSTPNYHFQHLPLSLCEDWTSMTWDSVSELSSTEHGDASKLKSQCLCVPDGTSNLETFNHVSDQLKPKAQPQNLADQQSVGDRTLNANSQDDSASKEQSQYMDQNLVHATNRHLLHPTSNTDYFNSSFPMDNEQADGGSTSNSSKHPKDCYSKIAVDSSTENDIPIAKPRICHANKVKEPSSRNEVKQSPRGGEKSQHQSMFEEHSEVMIINSGGPAFAIKRPVISQGLQREFPVRVRNAKMGVVAECSLVSHRSPPLGSLSYFLVCELLQQCESLKPSFCTGFAINKEGNALFVGSSKDEFPNIVCHKAFRTFLAAILYAMKQTEEITCLDVSLYSILNTNLTTVVTADDFVEKGPYVREGLCAATIKAMHYSRTLETKFWIEQAPQIIHLLTKEKSGPNQQMLTIKSEYYINQTAGCNLVLSNAPCPPVRISLQDESHFSPSGRSSSPKTPNTRVHCGSEGFLVSTEVPEISYSFLDRPFTEISYPVFLEKDSEMEANVSGCEKLAQQGISMKAAQINQECFSEDTICTAPVTDPSYAQAVETTFSSSGTECTCRKESPKLNESGHASLSIANLTFDASQMDEDTKTHQNDQNGHLMLLKNSPATELSGGLHETNTLPAKNASRIGTLEQSTSWAERLNYSNYNFQTSRNKKDAKSRPNLVSLTSITSMEFEGHVSSCPATSCQWKKGKLSPEESVHTSSNTPAVKRRIDSPASLVKRSEDEMASSKSTSTCLEANPSSPKDLVEVYYDSNSFRANSRSDKNEEASTEIRVSVDSDEHIPFLEEPAIPVDIIKKDSGCLETVNKTQTSGQICLDGEIHRLPNGDQKNSEVCTKQTVTQGQLGDCHRGTEEALSDALEEKQRKVHFIQSPVSDVSSVAPKEIPHLQDYASEMVKNSSSSPTRKKKKKEVGRENRRCKPAKITHEETQMTPHFIIKHVHSRTVVERHMPEVKKDQVSLKRIKQRQALAYEKKVRQLSLTRLLNENNNAYGGDYFVTVSKMEGTCSSEVFCKLG